MNLFPTASAYELNLDWILAQVKRFAHITGTMESSAEDIEHAVETSDQALETANAAMDMISQAVTVTPSDVDPEPNGSSSPGSANTYSRGDHVHPTDTTRASQSDLISVNRNVTNLTNVIGGITGNAILNADSMSVGIPHIGLFDANTQNTPASEYATLKTDGLFIGYAPDDENAVQVVFLAGETAPYIRIKNGSSTWTSWYRMGGA